MAVSPDADPKAKAKKLYWDEAVGGPLLLEAARTGVWSTELALMHMRLAKKFLGGIRYWRHDREVKEDMCGAAYVAAISYVKTYDPAKSNSSTPAYTWLTMVTQTAMHRYLKAKHYKHINLDSTVRQFMADNQDMFVFADEDPESLDSNDRYDV